MMDFYLYTYFLQIQNVLLDGYIQGAKILVCSHFQIFLHTVIHTGDIITFYADLPFIDTLPIPHLMNKAQNKIDAIQLPSV